VAFTTVPDYTLWTTHTALDVGKQVSTKTHTWCAANINWTWTIPAAISSHVKTDYTTTK